MNGISEHMRVRHAQSLPRSPEETRTRSRRQQLVVGLLLAAAITSLSSVGWSPARADSGQTGAAGQGDEQPSGGSSSPQDASIKSRLARLETRFCSFTHPHDDNEKRLERLETAIYGDVRKGPVIHRLDNIEQMLSSSDFGATIPNTAGKPAPRKTPPRPDTTPETTAASSAPEEPPSPATEDEVAAAPPVMPAPVVDQQAGSSTGGAGVAPAVEEKKDKPKTLLCLHLEKKMFSDPEEDPRKAIQEVSKVLRNDPLDCMISDLLLRRAKAHVALGQYTAAIEDLGKAINQTPMRTDLYLARAWLYKMSGQDFQAKSDIVRARFTDPTLPDKIDFVKPGKDKETETASSSSSDS